MESRKDLSCFVIEGAERADEGNYNICVTNPAGEDKAMIFVKIVGKGTLSCRTFWCSMKKTELLLNNELICHEKTNLYVPSDVPDPPENVKCTAVGEDCATIVWEPPKFDGGVPIKGNEQVYILYIMWVCICQRDIF